MEELKILRQLNILKCQQAGPGTKHQRPVGNQQGSKNETEMKKSSRWHDPKKQFRNATRGNSRHF